MPVINTFLLVYGLLVALAVLAGITLVLLFRQFLRHRTKKILLDYVSFQQAVPLPGENNQAFINQFQDKVTDNLFVLMENYVMVRKQTWKRMSWADRRAQARVNQRTYQAAERFWRAAKKYGFRVYSNPRDYAQLEQRLDLAGNYIRMNRFATF